MSAYTQGPGGYAGPRSDRGVEDEVYEFAASREGGARRWKSIYGTSDNLVDSAIWRHARIWKDDQSSCGVARLTILDQSGDNCRPPSACFSVHLSRVQQAGSLRGDMEGQLKP